MELKTEILTTFDKLIQVVDLFKKDQLDVIPFEGSWTAGQVAEHILKAVSNLPQFLKENTEPTLRAYDEKCASLRQLFLDFSTKMKSPEFIIPVDTHHDKEELLNSMQILKAQMLDAAEHLDLTLTCKSFEMPGMGYMTRMEWMTFFLVHTQRHARQLSNIFKVLNGKSEVTKSGI